MIEHIRRQDIGRMALVELNRLNKELDARGTYLSIQELLVIRQARLQALHILAILGVDRPDESMIANLGESDRG